MKNTPQMKGMTLIEVMITLAIVSIIAIVALPAYKQQLVESNRNQAKTLLLQLKLQQESYRLENISYASAAQLGDPTIDYYAFSSLDLSATTFTLKLIATSGQNQAGDTGCTTLTIDQSMNRLPADCW